MATSPPTVLLGGVCFHPGHRPPNPLIYSNGQAEHTCIGCGATQTFSAPQVPEWMRHVLG